MLFLWYKNMSDINSRDDIIALLKKQPEISSNKLKETPHTLAEGSASALKRGDEAMSAIREAMRYITSEDNGNHCITTEGTKHYIYFRPSKTLLGTLNVRVANQNNKI
jgi:hypothetical protein